MKTTVVSVQPVMDQRTGQQRTYSKDGKTTFYFHYTLANGQQGEAGHQSQQPRFPVGSEVEATDATNPQYPQYPKLKLDKPGGFGGGSKASDPEYQARLKAAGMVQAAIAGGAKTDAEIDAAVMLGFGAADRWKERLMSMQQPQQQPVQQQYAQPQQGGAGTPPWAANPGKPFHPQTGAGPGLPTNPNAGQVYGGGQPQQ
ncbi:MAG TPA: hypothetical protein PKJ19_13595, partial [Flavobacteriales bacterium]|nr:hypothetical protein [Flavobacteriales bacterium]